MMGSSPRRTAGLSCLVRDERATERYTATVATANECRIHVRRKLCRPVTPAHQPIRRSCNIDRAAKDEYFQSGACVTCRNGNHFVVSGSHTTNGRSYPAARRLRPASVHIAQLSETRICESGSQTHRIKWHRDRLQLDCPRQA